MMRTVPAVDASAMYVLACACRAGSEAPTENVPPPGARGLGIVRAVDELQELYGGLDAHARTLKRHARKDGI